MGAELHRTVRGKDSEMVGSYGLVTGGGCLPRLRAGNINQLSSAIDQLEGVALRLVRSSMIGLDAETLTGASWRKSACEGWTRSERHEGPHWTTGSFNAGTFATARILAARSGSSNLSRSWRVPPTRTGTPCSRRIVGFL